LAAEPHGRASGEAILPGASPLLAAPPPKLYFARAYAKLPAMQAIFLFSRAFICFVLVWMFIIWLFIRFQGV